MIEDIYFPMQKAVQIEGVSVLVIRLMRDLKIALYYPRASVRSIDTTAFKDLSRKLHDAILKSPIK